MRKNKNMWKETWILKERWRGLEETIKMGEMRKNKDMWKKLWRLKEMWRWLEETIKMAKIDR